uniref:Tax1 (human T-cell leukemia virus type I) binding protein 1a n=1 Tax=Cyclopterus lumpus TaxID=8103 RepID=A0A8C3G910_CYCLU
METEVLIMETSNFAHVIFQNVGKSFMPQAPLECCYTLTPYITPNPKDWVGIFKVRHTHHSVFYSEPASKTQNPLCESHALISFVGYYVPKSDGEFYQFCYVSHVGDIRGASTPFQFRSATPTDELLTLQEEQRRLAREREQERETCSLLRTHNQVRKSDGTQRTQQI